MAFRLKPGLSVPHELRRVATKQLAAAAAGLRDSDGADVAHAIADARRRVKKVRALLRLVRPALSSGVRPSGRYLRGIDRLLAPATDAASTAAALARLGGQYRAELPAEAWQSVLVHYTDGRPTGSAPRLDALRQSATDLLRAEIARLRSWQPEDAGFVAVAPGLIRSVRRARDAMVDVCARPTECRFHVWRQRVRDHLFHVRLLEGFGRQMLVARRHRLETLDGLLNECRETALARAAILDTPALARSDAARMLRVLRRHEARCRLEARRVGEVLFAESPQRFVRRVARAWESEGDSTVRLRSGERLATVGGDGSAARREVWRAGS
jgi:hypothetical protein